MRVNYLSTAVHYFYKSREEQAAEVCLLLGWTAVVYQCSGSGLLWSAFFRLTQLCVCTSLKQGKAATTKRATKKKSSLTDEANKYQHFFWLNYVNKKVFVLCVQFVSLFMWSAEYLSTRALVSPSQKKCPLSGGW